MLFLLIFVVVLVGLGFRIVEFFGKVGAKVNRTINKE